jgi:integrase
VVVPISTDAQIRSLEKKPGRRLLIVAGIPGLRLDIRPSGAMIFVLKYRTRARQPRTFTIGPYPDVSLKQAREKAKEARALVALGGDPQAERIELRRATAAKTSVVTVGQLTRWMLGLDKDGPRPLKIEESTRAGWERIATKEIIPAFGKTPAPDLLRADIRRWGARIAKRAPYMANRSFEVLRRVFSWSVENDLIETTPFYKLPEPFADEEASDRWLSTEELNRVLAALGEGVYADAFRLLLLTGVRLTMVLSARASEFEDLKGDNPRWIIPADKTKGDRPHVVPLSTQALAIVNTRLDRLEKGRLFPPIREAEGPHMRWSSKWVKNLRERIGTMPRWTVHGLRHTIGTHMVEDLKVPRSVVSLILLHAAEGPAVSRIYVRAELLDERRDALQRWADWVDGLKN